MKKLNVTILAMLAILLLTSCDPGKILTIRADKGGATSVTVYTNHRIVPFADTNDSSKLTIQVPYKDTTIRSFNYGLGTWPNESIEELAGNIDSIVIVNQSSKLVLVSKLEIQQHLRKNRSGWGGSVLTIEAK